MKAVVMFFSPGKENNLQVSSTSKWEMFIYTPLNQSGRCPIGPLPRNFLNIIGLTHFGHSEPAGEESHKSVKEILRLLAQNDLGVKMKGRQ